MKFTIKGKLLMLLMITLGLSGLEMTPLQASLLPPIRLDYADSEVGMALKLLLTQEFNFPDSFIEESYVENMNCLNEKIIHTHSQWYLCVDQKGELYELYRNPTFVEKTIKAFYGK